MSESLYALLNRQELDRAHRLLVAQRLAEAVEVVHAAGGVIGNLDDHHVLVDPDGTVKLSDNVGADTEGRAPAYTAPELQGSVPGRSRPEAQHDAFALAVLLFQLLMEGNHPYAGQWVGGGNLPEIPKAIQLGLYAYGNSAVMPPPGAPALSTLEPGLADLFKRSFGATSAIFRNRPTGAEWARALAAVRQTGQAVLSPTSLTSQELANPHGPVLGGPQVLVTPVAPTTPVVLDSVPDSAPQSAGSSRVQPDPFPEPRTAPTPRISTPTPMVEATTVESSQVQRATVPGTLAPNPSEPRQDSRLPEPAVATDVAPRQAAGMPAARAKRKFSRRVILERVVPPASAPDDPTAPVQPNQSQGSVWSDLVGELRWLAAPDQSQPSAPDQPHPSALDQQRPAAAYQPEPSAWGSFVSEISWLAESELRWLTDPEFWRRFGKFVVPGLLFVIWLAFGRSGDDSSNRDARPATLQATRAPATLTPRSRPTATQTPRSTTTRIAVNNPPGASFGSNFDVSDGMMPSTGERFSASIRDRALRLEVFGTGTHGKTMFNAAPAPADFHFTVRVGSTTGQGEILIYVDEPGARRTLVIAVNPAASTWRAFAESVGSITLVPLIPPRDYATAIARAPLRTITVTRKDGRTSVSINAASVSTGVLSRVPQLSGPVKVGVGAMIPEDPEHYDGESFVVTVDRVAMVADKE